MVPVFSAAGIPTVFDSDMQSWLRTHAALVAPLMTSGVIANARNGGITWREARLHAKAFRAGAQIVRNVGSTWRPGFARFAFALPQGVVAALFWLFNRTQLQRDLGKLGRAEPRMLIDMMCAAAPELGGPLKEIRP